MSEQTINYLIYNTEADALERADAEGARRGYAYHKIGSGTRYHTSPRITADNKYALQVNNYELTSEEESAIVTSVTFPVEEV
tara:strand:+ start:766 stop:1011 length:246 start_codon:yes stop_codon:yes gene_type:complete